MNATDFVWLLVGSGVGILVSRIASRSRRPVISYPEKGTSEPSANDVSEVRSLQEQLQQAKLAYSMAAQMSQFKGSFLARTSHELRSPLNGIIGMHQLILSDLADSPEEEHDFLTQAHESALKMIKLLDEVIDAAKAEHGTSTLEIQPVQLVALLQNVYSLTHLQARNRTIQLIVDYPTEELYIAADPRRLRQSLVSLVDSAIAHLQEGHIRLFVECQPDSDCCSICIDTPVPAVDWLDQIDSPTPEHEHNFLETTLSKESLLQLAAHPFPSLGFVFSLAKSLLRSMQGQLELKSSGHLLEFGEASQIRCMIPLVPFEPSID